jgi:membrane AbrB-like protein
MKPDEFAGILIDLRKLVITFTIAVLVGYGFLYLHFPAPFLMGSLFGVWIIGGIFPSLQPQLGVARWFHVPVVLGLGVFIGANFTAALIKQATHWMTTVSIMIVVTLIVSALGYAYLRKVRQYDPVMALLCAVPGGQAEAIVMARDMVEKDYVVALFHLIRVTVVFVSTPLLLAMLEGSAAVATSNERLLTMPGLFDLSSQQFFSFIGIAVAGYGLARILSLPMPHLLGPMGLSMAFHISGVVFIPRINEFIMLAQLAIGGGVGARLAQVKFRSLLVYLGDGLLTSGIILVAYLLVALGISYFTHAGFLSIWLAFVPGGLYEVTLLALIFGFDIAFIAFHHTIRVFLIFLTMPVLATRLNKKIT